ncbi:MAG: hypothetical protein PHG66_00535 [Candidatus Colwellbacteria bacterium]|nr:hypothetical protein [Candidatus Colwellbacteria bacterium]
MRKSDYLGNIGGDITYIQQLSPTITMSTPTYTYTTVDEVEFKTHEVWRLNGHRHRTDGPAWKQWQVVNGVVVLTCEEWDLNGITHRIDGPACRQWEVVDGKAVLTSEGWRLNGKLHHTDGPAYRAWEVVAGQVVLTCEEWCLNGITHRVDGPAWRQCEVVDGKAVLTSEGWYIENAKIHPRVLRQPVRAIERWWRFHQARRQAAIEELLWESGMKVFPGLMGLLRKC